mmetsp:Transcript_10646/g.29498  ORF Transcript_10646/g.29498 Transcript_10646/m.29498 type:complete len:212 (-) Transcript_10646:768-1403(-)
MHGSAGLETGDTSGKRTLDGVLATNSDPMSATQDGEKSRDTEPCCTCFSTRSNDGDGDAQCSSSSLTSGPFRRDCQSVAVEVFEPPSSSESKFDLNAATIAATSYPESLSGTSALACKTLFRDDFETSLAPVSSPTARRPWSTAPRDVCLEDQHLANSCKGAAQLDAAVRNRPCEGDSNPAKAVPREVNELESEGSAAVPCSQICKREPRG